MPNMGSFKLEIPDDILEAARIPLAERKSVLKRELAVQLYARQILPKIAARRLAEMDRVAFDELLGQRGIASRLTPDEIDADVVDLEAFRKAADDTGGESDDVDLWAGAPQKVPSPGFRAAWKAAQTAGATPGCAQEESVGARFEDWPLHDAVLGDIRVDWRARTCTMTVRAFMATDQNAEPYVIRCSGVTLLCIPHRSPWGNSMFINGQHRPGERRYSIEMQSGDVIEIEADALELIHTSAP